jgi:hypothetical protein
MKHKAIWLSFGVAVLAAVVVIVVLAITHTNGSSEPSFTRPGDVTPQSNVAIIDNCANAGRVEPATIQLTCGSGTTVADGLSWNQWSSGIATGHGVINEVSCVPNCAKGKDIAYKVALALSQPVRAHSGARYFTRITVTYLGNSPTGNQTVVYTDCYVSPPAPYLPQCPKTNT